MLYAMPTRGSAWLSSVRPLYRSPRMPRLKMPVAGLDLIFDVRGQFLHVGMAEVRVVAAAAGQVVGQQEAGRVA